MCIWKLSYTYDTQVYSKEKCLLNLNKILKMFKINLNYNYCNNYNIVGKTILFYSKFVLLP